MNQLSELLSRWVAHRDGIVGRHTEDDNRRMEFLQALQAHAILLGDVLPPGLNVAQLEALAELSASWLGEVRTRNANARRAFFRP